MAGLVILGLLLVGGFIGLMVWGYRRDVPTPPQQQVVWQPTRNQMIGAGALGFVAGAMWEHHHQANNDLHQAQEARLDAAMAGILYHQRVHQPDIHMVPHYHHGVYWEEQA